MTDLLNERQKTHGSYAANCHISRQIKYIVREYYTHHNALNDIHAEALDMIAVKIGRILSGNANHKDHWDDIAGYATLAAKECEDD